MGLGDLYQDWHERGGDRESALSKPPPRSLFMPGDDASLEGAPMDDESIRLELLAEEPRAGSLNAPMRLGRHVEHDPRSLGFPAERSSTLQATMHTRWAPILDQGQLGSCTGNAMAGLLGTAPHVPAAGQTIDEAFAVQIYEAATHLDSVPGSYPPDDTGSSGLAVAKVARKLGLIHSYRHAFGLAHALGALVVGPVIIGINWYDSFDTPGPNGLIAIGQNAKVRGGHEVELIGLDPTAGTVRGCNSWGTGWGDGGFFTMSWRTLDRLLHEGGDCTAVA